MKKSKIFSNKEYITFNNTLIYISTSIMACY